DFWDAAYVAMNDAFGGANTDLSASIADQILGTLLSFASIALIPVLTASVVDAVVKSRLELRDGTLVRRATDHIIVAGLGGVGSPVVRLLHEQGFDVIGIDPSPTAPGVQVARELGVPVIIGDAGRRDVLASASIRSCRTLMVLTADDS